MLKLKFKKIFDQLVVSKYGDDFGAKLMIMGFFWTILGDLGQFKGNFNQFCDISIPIFHQYIGVGDISIYCQYLRWGNILISISILTKISKYRPLIWVGRNIGHPYT